MNENRLRKVMKHIRPGSAAYSVGINENGTAYLSFYDEEVNELPKPTDQELNSALMDAVKADKINELVYRSIEELSPHFTEDHGRDETIHLLAAHLVAVCDALNITVDSRLRSVVTVGEKARVKQDQVVKAINENEVDSVSWDTP